MNRRQTIPPQQKYTTKQFLADFPNDDACLEYMLNRRWPGGIALCVECRVERKHYRVTGRTCYACPVCGNHIFPLAGTIFHKSTTSLTTWFFVIKLMTSTRVGVSAKQIQRETGVTYKTAWRYLNEFAFRYNRRKVMVPMFTLLAERTTTQVCPSAYESRRRMLPSVSTQAQPW